MSSIFSTISLRPPCGSKSSSKSSSQKWSNSNSEALRGRGRREKKKSRKSWRQGRRMKKRTCYRSRNRNGSSTLTSRTRLKSLCLLIRLRNKINSLRRKTSRAKMISKTGISSRKTSQRLLLDSNNKKSMEKEDKWSRIEENIFYSPHPKLQLFK